MLHLLHREGLADQVRVESAGTAGYHVGAPADTRSAQAARQRGVALPSRAQQFQKEDFQRFDYVLCMDGNNYAELADLATEEDKLKIHLLRDFDPESEKGSSVPDPYYGGAQGFDLVLDLCFEACEHFLQHLIEEHDLQVGAEN